MQKKLLPQHWRMLFYHMEYGFKPLCRVNKKETFQLDQTLLKLQLTLDGAFTGLTNIAVSVNRHFSEELNMRSV